MQVEYLARAHGSNAFVGAHSNFVVVTGASRGLNHGVHRDIKEMLIGSAAIALSTDRLAAARRLHTRDSRATAPFRIDHVQLNLNRSSISSGRLAPSGPSVGLDRWLLRHREWKSLMQAHGQSRLSRCKRA